MNYGLSFLVLLAINNMHCMNVGQQSEPKFPEHLLFLSPALAQEFKLKYTPPYNCNQSGHFFLKKKNYEKAQQCYLPALTSNDLPTKHGALVQLSTIPQENLQADILAAAPLYPGNTFKKRTIHYFQDRIKQSNKDAIYPLAHIYYLHKKWAKAGKCLVTLYKDIQLGSSLPNSVLYLQGKIFIKLDKFEFAEESLDMINNPDDNVRIKLAFIAQQKKDFTAAHKYLAATDPHNLKALLYKGLLLKQENNVRSACTLLRQVSEGPFERYREAAKAALDSMGSH
jgi:hypothetical protein